MEVAATSAIATVCGRKSQKRETETEVSHIKQTGERCSDIRNHVSMENENWYGMLSDEKIPETFVH